MNSFQVLQVPLAGVGVAIAAIVFGLAAGALPPATAQDNPYGLTDPTVISVGTMGDAKPYAFSTADGNFTGFDIELLLDVARRIGFEKEQVIFTGQDFSALMPSVANGRFDVAAAAIGTTEKRKQTVDFSDGYLAGYLSVLTADEDITGAEGLKGKRLGVVQGTLRKSTHRRTSRVPISLNSRTITLPYPDSTTARSMRISSTTRRQKTMRADIRT